MIPFNNTYINLPENFYAEVTPKSFDRAKLILLNEALLEELQIDTNDKDELTKIFSGQVLHQKSQPLAQAYAGHQFGNFVPQLGDGRAVLLGEVLSKSNSRFDIQLKGSGMTPFSRGGDGKSSLGPVLREYIVSEAMYHLGIPTTRALAAIETGETVIRQMPTPGGLFTRVASSHIRVGTFQYLACRGDIEGIKELTDYTIKRHYPNLNSSKSPYLDFIQEVAKKQARLVAKWMAVGFIHGVMNTDNMSVSGETIDFGPCAFMDEFKFNKVFSSIDRYGRYAYNNQIKIAQWNLYRLAECLIPIIDDDENKAIKYIQETLESSIQYYDQFWLEEMVKKFGIENPNQGDRELINDWLNYLEENELDFTIAFRELSKDLNSHPKFKDRILERQSESSIELMLKTNPIYIPRNHQIERAIENAYNGDFQLFYKLTEVVKTPFNRSENYEEFEKAPQKEERVTATFCGT
jgi:uncharacterized protein YdiU (UPF0061 family)